MPPGTCRWRLTENTFLRGDSSADGAVDIADAIFTLNYLFARGTTPHCLDAVDANDDGGVDISDSAYTISFLFLGGPAIPLPYPEPGADPTLDSLACLPSQLSIRKENYR